MRRPISACMLKSRASGKKILLNSVTCEYAFIDEALEVKTPENFVVIVILLKGLLQGRVDHKDWLLPGKVIGKIPRCNIITKKLNPGN